MLHPGYFIASLSRCCLFFSCLANLARLVRACFIALWLVLLLACFCCFPSVVVSVLDQTLEFVGMFMESVSIASIGIFSLFSSYLYVSLRVLCLIPIVASSLFTHVNITSDHACRNRSWRPGRRRCRGPCGACGDGRLSGARGTGD